MFVDSQVTLIGSESSNLIVTINQEKAFTKVFYLTSRTKNSNKRASFPIEVKVCGSETLTVAKPSILFKKMQNTGKIYITEEIFSREFINS